MTTGNNFKKGKYTLVYSQTAAESRGFAGATTNDGDAVSYTLMTDEEKFGDWQKNYLWEDAVVVGYIDSSDQVTHANLKYQEGLRRQRRRFR